MADNAKHIRSVYEQDLASLTDKLAEMGGYVEAMLSDSVTALENRNAQQAEAVIPRDQEANRLQEVIDAEVLRVLALRRPVAGDLRRVMAATKIAGDLERIGDLAVSVARHAAKLTGDPTTPFSVNVSRIGRLVVAQLKVVLDGLMKEDTDKVLRVWLADDDVDALYALTFRDLVAQMVDEPHLTVANTELIFAGKRFERAGDHAQNIAEHVYYAIHGRPLIKDPAVTARESAEEV